jgi:hypothetical protein
MLYSPYYPRYQRHNARDARGQLLRGLFAALAAAVMLAFCAHAHADIGLSTGASFTIAGCDTQVAGVE